MNNPDHIAIYDIWTIAEIDPDIVPFLGEPVGCVFERKSELDTFVKCNK